MATHSSPFPESDEKRSPFPRPSLPQAGESLGDAAHDLYLNKFLFFVMLAMFFGALALIEWVMRWMGTRVSPWAWVALGVVAGGIALWERFRIDPQLAKLRQGIRGEREVGRMLEQMRSLGYEVFHDIPGEGFNLDHVLIGPGGLFAIETKTISKRRSRDAKVEYDGHRVLIDGHAPDRDPIAQAQASADHLRNLLKRMTDRDVAVRPVVLFPGWFITRQPPDAHVWVLNVPGLRAFLEHEATQLSREDIALFSDRLTLHLST